MIPRHRWLTEVRGALARSRVTALIGPRQSGKTTLARQIVPLESPAYFDLEDPRSLARLAEPMTALAPLRGIVVIDEVQRRPDLFPILRGRRTGVPFRHAFSRQAAPGRTCCASPRNPWPGRLETIVLSGLALLIGRRALAEALAAGRIPAVLPGPVGESESSLAPPVHPNLSLARPAATGNYDILGKPVWILVHARALPWRHLERGRGGSLSRRFGADRTARSGPALRPFPGPSTPAMA